MNKVLIGILIFSCCLFGGIASAQEPSVPPSAPSSEAAQPPTRIASGSVIPVSLLRSIDAKKAKTGDEVVAKVTEDMKTNSGEVLVPKDTKVLGRVTEAQSRNKEQKESAIGIAFDRAVTKNGGEMQMPMSIQAIIVPQDNQDSAGGTTGSIPNTGTGGYPTPSRAGGMAGSPPAPTSSAPSMGSSMPSDAQTRTNARPTITAQTEGVIGISDVKLTTAAWANQGSLVSSEKNNVKIESGTLMLLRVN
jgi:Bacterial conjugation TrbI-like protein